VWCAQLAAPTGGTQHPAVAAQVVRVCVLTVSDRASRGEYPDETGPAVAAALAAQGHINAQVSGLRDTRALDC
jgi:molybdopterin biosynthesis enzyme MoaB